MVSVMARRTRRDDIFDFICAYAEEMGGPTPSIGEVAQHFGYSYKTAYHHVLKLIYEGKLRQERGKLLVVDAYWKGPADWANGP